MGKISLRYGTIAGMVQANHPLPRAIGVALVSFYFTFFVPLIKNKMGLRAKIGQLDNKSFVLLILRSGKRELRGP